MKTKLFITFVAASLFCVYAANAQGLSVTLGENVYSETGPTGKNPQDMDIDAQSSVFKFPVKTVDYQGRKIDAMATVIYQYDKQNNDYPKLILKLRLWPKSDEVEIKELTDSIKKYGRYNTIIRHLGIDRKGRVQNFKGQADVFTYASVPYFDTQADAKAIVKYNVTFDPENENACKISLNISRAEWAAPDFTTNVSTFTFAPNAKNVNLQNIDKITLESLFTGNEESIWNCSQDFSPSIISDKTTSGKQIDKFKLLYGTFSFFFLNKSTKAPFFYYGKDQFMVIKKNSTNVTIQDIAPVLPYTNKDEQIGNKRITKTYDIGASMEFRYSSNYKIINNTFYTEITSMSCLLHDNNTVNIDE